jgi:hypothetical protein
MSLPCTAVEVVGSPRHHAVVVRALEQEGLSCRWRQAPPGRNGEQHDLTLVIHATGGEQVAAEVVGQLRLMHPNLRVTIEGPC